MSASTLLDAVTREARRPQQLKPTDVFPPLPAPLASKLPRRVAKLVAEVEDLQRQTTAARAKEFSLGQLTPEVRNRQLLESARARREGRSYDVDDMAEHTANIEAAKLEADTLDAQLRLAHAELLNEFAAATGSLEDKMNAERVKAIEAARDAVQKAIVACATVDAVHDARLYVQAVGGGERPLSASRLRCARDFQKPNGSVPFAGEALRAVLSALPEG